MTQSNPTPPPLPPPISPLPDEDRRQRRIASNASQNSIAMFVVFCLQVVFLAMVGLQVEIPVSGCVGLFIPAGAIFAAIYLPLRWRVIQSLPATIRNLGLIGGFGMMALAVLGLIGLLVSSIR